jgi:uncharacterized membrane protein YphA (DoxX/SURF4 family)
MSDEYLIDFQNPPDISFVLLFSLIGTFFILLGLFGSPGQFVLMVILASFIFLMIFHREYYHRPKSIAVGKEGFTFHYRFGSKRYIEFDDIQWLKVVPENPNTSKKKYDKNMGLKLKGGLLPFPLTWEAAKAIENNYIKKMGSKPPWD